ncbi:MAG: hydrolase [Pseudonocardia sp.]|nr:hydrolase [Pseudonocardia sp.]
MPAGDGWTRCARGHRHWGLFGAAGLLAQHRSDDGTRWLLMQHRASWSHHGDTWGLLGGARAPDETAVQAAGREAWEEASLPASAYTVTGQYVDDHGGWSYVTVFAEAGSLVPITALSAESTEVVWVRQDELAGLTLHPGFAASWPSVADLIA